MRYAFLIYGDEAAAAEVTPEEWEEIIEAHNAFGREARERGMMAGGEALQPTGTATTVQVRPGKGQFVTDGPFAETREQLGGFYLLDCADLDEALEMAKKLPLTNGCVEIRPVMTFD